jgi:two-component system sensor histidine kinase VicK
MLSQGYVGDLSKEQKRMIDVAYKNNGRQLEIIEDLLRVAKVDAGKVYLEKFPSDIVMLVEAVIKEQAILFMNRGQRVLFPKPRKQIMATIDPKLISMVLDNLLDNAGKYSPNGGQITVNIEQTDKQTTVSVQDMGVGIRKSEFHKLFKKFSRIDNPFSISVVGTGLGLYWAKKILDLHEGSIEVTSKLNKGSTFTVRMPVLT